MNRYKRVIKVITAAGQLREFEGWEVRQVHDECSALVLQNPDSGEKVKLSFGEGCFKHGSLKVIRRKEVGKRMNV